MLLAPTPATLRGVLRTLFDEHGLWVAIICTYLGIGLAADGLGIVDIVRAFPFDFGYWLHLLALVIYWPILLLMWRRLGVRSQTGGRVHGLLGWRLAIQRWRHDVTLERVGGAVVAATLTVFTVSTHDAWKSAIGVLEPVTWDYALSAVDRTLHGGRHPWEWLQTWLATPARTRWLDLSYMFWYPIFTVVLIWQCWNPNRLERRRFFVAFALAWVVLGTIVAHLFASGGPVFYGGLVAGPDPYHPLRDYLATTNETMPLTAVALEQAVWTNYINGARSLWVSMSAMPSLHVSMAALFALGTWTSSRFASLVLWGFTGLTMVGAVHLGWHYAIDGYVAVLGTWACWRITARPTKHYLPRHTVKVIPH